MSDSEGPCPNQPATTELGAVPGDITETDENMYTVKANYFELLSSRSLMKYRVVFAADSYIQNSCDALVRQHENVIGKYILDGNSLYCVNTLPEPFELESMEASETGKPIKIVFYLESELQKNDNKYIEIMNLIVHRCFEKLNLSELNDPETVRILQQHGLRLWPDYSTSFSQHGQRLLLRVDVNLQVVRTETALDVITKYRSQGQDVCKAALEGKFVLTEYNNRTYRIKSVAFDKNPKTQFYIFRENRHDTYINYYHDRYDVNISDDSQPLLLHPACSDRNRGDDHPAYLIPELCIMNGVSNEMRENDALMKDVENATRLTTESRTNWLLRFMNRIARDSEIMKELNSWGLELPDIEGGPHLVECNAYRIPSQLKILHSENYHSEDGDWTDAMKGLRLDEPSSLGKWIVICPIRLKLEMEEMISIIAACGESMNFQIDHPKIHYLDGDDLKPSDYTDLIRTECSCFDYYLAMAVMETQNTVIYDALKKLTLLELGIPSEVITGDSLKGKEDDIRSIAMKVTIQMAAKQGAVPWQSTFCRKDWMVCGLYTNYDFKQGKPVTVFVTSFNESFTRYTSSVFIHDKYEELSEIFSRHLRKALRVYYEKNGKLPESIFVYHDSGGTANVPRVKEIDIKKIKEACRIQSVKSGSYDPTIAYVVASKRMNTRFFLSSNRSAAIPPPGVVVDNTVTVSEGSDFFLVSLCTKQGSVPATYYKVKADDTGTSLREHQLLAYALTHLYFNWAGTVRIPAPCQYARKLSHLVVESLHAPPHEKLTCIPFYL